MKIVALIIMMQLVVTLLTGCAEFPIDAKIEEMNRLNCKPAGSPMCDGWAE